MDFMESVLGLVGTLALDKGAQASLGRSSTLPTLLETVRTSPLGLVKRLALLALAAIAMENSQNQSRITEAGGISIILTAARAFAIDSTVVLAALNLAKELVVGDEATAQRFVDEGGLKTTLLVMKKHFDKGPLQVAACHIIAYLPYEEENPVAPKVAEAIVHALENHAMDAEVQALGCEALLEIVTHVPSVRKLVKKKATQELLIAAKEEYEDCVSDVDDLLAACK